MLVDRETESNRPGNIRASRLKLRDVCPELIELKYWFFRRKFELFAGESPKKFLNDCLKFGDANPAVVLSTEPLLVAAYSEDLDCALLVRYPDVLVEKYALQPKMKLLTVNMYDEKSEPEDVVPGPKNSGLWTDYMPRIAEFLSDDLDRINARKKSFPSDIWPYVLECGQRYKKSFPGLARSGNPLRNEGVRYR